MYKDAEYIFRFLGTTWRELPAKDRKIFAEMWRGFEQVWADQLQRIMEYDLAVSLESCPVYITERWNSYAFDSTTQSDVAASYTSKWDISEGVDLSIKSLFAFKINGVLYEVDVRGSTPTKTTIDEVISKVNEEVKFAFASAAYSNTTLKFTTAQVGPAASIEFVVPSDPALNCSDLLLGFDSSELPIKFPEYAYRYRLPDAKIWHIPTLQNAIHDEKTTTMLLENVHYQVDPGKAVVFKEEPAEQLWAKVTKLNHRTAAYNFGWLIDYNDQSISPEEYLITLQGLWFTYWMGPRPEFIRRSLSLLFGLPVARRSGIVSEVYEDPAGGPDGYIVITEDRDLTEITYTIPRKLRPTVQVGNLVDKFTPLTTGVDVFDKVNLPGFVKTEIGRANIGRFLTQNATTGEGDTDETRALDLLEEHTYLPQVDVYAFIRSVDLSIIKTFLDGIRPLHKVYHFQVVVANLHEELTVGDTFQWSMYLNLEPNLDSNPYIYTLESERELYEEGGSDYFHLDSEGVTFGERGEVEVADWNGPRPDLSQSW